MIISMVIVLTPACSPAAEVAKGEDPLDGIAMDLPTEEAWMATGSGLARATPRRERRRGHPPSQAVIQALRQRGLRPGPPSGPAARRGPDSLKSRPNFRNTRSPPQAAPLREEDARALDPARSRLRNPEPAP